MLQTLKSMGFWNKLVLRKHSPSFIHINQKRYRVIRKLSQTPHGLLYLCRSDSTGKFVLKKQHNCFDDEAERLFLEEYQILSSLNHPNVVAAIDYGFDERIASYFIVMEYVEGKMLWQSVQESTEHEIYQYFFQSLQVCHYLHDRGIIHCDIKPDNILITADRRVKMSDFGVATRTGAGIKGISPAFVAPEHLFNAEEARAYRPTDLYALGVSFYWLLTGVHPYCPENDPLPLQEEYFANKPTPPTELNPTINPKWNECLIGLIDTDPTQRVLTASMIVNHFDFDSSPDESCPPRT